MRRSGGIFRTKAEAEEARARLHAAIVAGIWRPPSPGDTPKLALYARSWLEQSERNETLSPRTVALYRHQLERLVLPDLGSIALGDVPVGKLGREVVKKWEIAARDAARANA